MRRLRPWLLAALVPPAAAAACAVYGPSLLVPGDGGDAGGGADAEAGATCTSERAPPRPSADDPGGTDVEVVTAIRTTDFGLSPDGGPIGFGVDLDGHCTCQGMGESCVPAAGAPLHCDGVGGRDVAGNELMQKLGLLLKDFFSVEGVTRGFEKGETGMLLRVQGWNGRPNDRTVAVSFYVSTGTPQDDAGTPRPPAWDGTDAWEIEPKSVKGGLLATMPYVPMYVDSAAYVAGGIVVASIDFPFTLANSASGTTISLKGSVVTGRLVPEGASYRVEDGLISGRWVTQQLLTALQVTRDPLVDGGYLCGDSGTYQAVKAQICRAADVTSDLSSDGKNAPCNAISIAARFTSFPARFGAVVDNRPQLTPCGVAYTDDCR